MSVLIRFAPTSAVTTEQYDETIRRLQEAGDFPPEGMEYHVCFLQTGTSGSARSGTRGSNSTHSGSASCPF